jgi:hypothetical protein
LLAPLFAGALSLASLSLSVRSYVRCRQLVAESRSVPEDDELEQRLAARERVLKLGLAAKTVQVFGRASLFGGTGAAVWELSGGSSHYLGAGVAFGLGFVGWAGSSDFGRRIGSLAGGLPKRSRYREQK